MVWEVCICSVQVHYFPNTVELWLFDSMNTKSTDTEPLDTEGEPVSGSVLKKRISTGRSAGCIHLTHTWYVLLIYSFYFPLTQLCWTKISTEMVHFPRVSAPSLCEAGNLNTCSRIFRSFWLTDQMYLGEKTVKLRFLLQSKKHNWSRAWMPKPTFVLQLFWHV